MKKRKKRAAEVVRGVREPEPETTPVQENTGVPAQATLAWGKEEQSPRLSPDAGVGARLSGFRDDAERVVRRPVTFGGDGVRPGRPTEGRVVYVHPLGRFHVVEFEMPCGRKVRESFWGTGNSV